MPRMCGLEATGIIRNMEREAAAAAAAAAAADPRKRVGVFPPAAIIGLTANASQEDESDCLNAGMDSFLSKPVRGGAAARPAGRSNVPAVAMAFGRGASPHGTAAHLTTRSQRLPPER